MKKRNEKIKNNYRREKLFVVALLVLEFIFLGALVLTPITYSVVADVAQNVTVTTTLNVGSVAPEILNVTIFPIGGIDLTANATTAVLVEVIARDFNGEGDIANISAEFFDNVASSYGGTDDNNEHYTNVSCNLDFSYGTIYEVNSTCRFDVEYYANNATWNSTAFVIDNTSRNDTGSDTETINTLLALSLPAIIDYGTVNATDVSNENITNVTNFGNVRFNLTLEGYGANQFDNLSMNCSLGTSNISIEYERYNLTTSNTGDMTLDTFNGNYTNLSSLSVVRAFNLNYRQNDTAPFHDDSNTTYWRIYVPAGAAGTCTGNIIFGAILSPE